MGRNGEKSVFCSSPQQYAMCTPPSAVSRNDDTRHQGLTGIWPPHQLGNTYHAVAPCTKPKSELLRHQGQVRYPVPLEKAPPGAICTYCSRETAKLRLVHGSVASTACCAYCRGVQLGWQGEGFRISRKCASYAHASMRKQLAPTMAPVMRETSPRTSN